MALGLKYRRNDLYKHLDACAANEKATPALKKAIADVVAHKDADDIDQFIPALEAAAKAQGPLCDGGECHCMEKILTNLDQLSKKSV
ncbi:MAG: hypothetical protein MJ223_00325 [Mycoplasmoidaceae bacterium]|nr:hypothetical protein [Mycoplasmoidaceae bacterium]